MHDLPESMKRRVRRWRAAHPEWKQRERVRYYRQFQDNDRNKGKPWTERELERIMAPQRPPDFEVEQESGAIGAGHPDAAVQAEGVDGGDLLLVGPIPTKLKREVFEPPFCFECGTIS